MAAVGAWMRVPRIGSWMIGRSRSATVTNRGTPGASRSASATRWIEATSAGLARSATTGPAQTTTGVTTNPERVA